MTQPKSGSPGRSVRRKTKAKHDERAKALKKYNGVPVEQYDGLIDTARELLVRASTAEQSQHQYGASLAALIMDLGEEKDGVMTLSVPRSVVEVLGSDWFVDPDVEGVGDEAVWTFRLYTGDGAKEKHVELEAAKQAVRQKVDEALG